MKKENYVKLNLEKAMMLMKSLKNTLAIGTSDFKKLRKDGSFYIDKSLFIKEVIEPDTQISLITRPRRFGKTLNMSMLKYFFDINENSKNIFKDLKIMKENKKYLGYMNNVPTIFLSFNGISSYNYDEMLNKIKFNISMLYRKHSYLLNSSKLLKDDKELFSIIMHNKNSNKYNYPTEFLLKLLNYYLYLHYDKEVLILLDEYDVPLINAYTNGYYSKAVSFFKSFFTNIFKDNEYLYKGVLTGVSRVSKESIFSGLNNIKVYTLFDNAYEESFGFTEEEIKYVLEKYDLTGYFDDIQSWYDGYNVGEKTDLYNPWSILNFFSELKFKPYWANTSGNDLIKMIFAKSSIDVKEKLEDLIQNKEVKVEIDLNTVIPNIEKNESNIWGLFLQTGYLKPNKHINDNKYIVKIPNKEVRKLFETIVNEWCYSTKSKTLNYLINLKLDLFKDSFQRLTIEMFSYLDVKENEDENFYHAFVLGMLVELKEKYVVLSNRESGEGRYDICLEPLNKNEPAFVIEFKSCKEKSFEKAIEEAKDQIIKQKYETDLKQRGCTSITKMALAFKGKDVKMQIFN